jgi:predicted RecB family endonuclease
LNIKKLGRTERALGDLLPKIVVEYYEKLNFSAAETCSVVDQQFKIDIIATKQGEVHAIQVKKGQISS